MSKQKKHHNDLDIVLEEVGDFGNYQIYTFTLYTLAVIVHSATHNAFVFTALNVDYR